MGRGVTAACLSLLIWHGLSLAQLPPTAPLAPVLETTAPMAPVSETVIPGRGGLLANVDSILPGCQVWVGAEYLLYFLNGSRVPVPLVTSGVTSNPNAGAIGETGTQVLLGDQRFNQGAYHGGRVRVGFDLVDCGLGIEAIGFMLDQEATTTGYPNDVQAPSVLGLPFINHVTDTEDVAQISFPNVTTGDVSFKMRTNLSGYEVNLGYACNTYVVDWGFVGYRYLNLAEAMFMTSNFQGLQNGALTYLGADLPAGSTGSIQDTFRCKNEFYGGQFGAVKRIVYRNVALETRASVAFGTTRQQVTIDGYSSANGGPQVQGGLLAQPSNSGTTIRDQFSVIPEVNVTLFVQLHDNVVAFAGYNFLFWNNVSRPGFEIDRRVDLSQAPFGPSFNGTAQPPHPSVQYQNATDLIVHGLNAGLGVQF